MRDVGKLCFDVHDSDNIDEDSLRECLMYFKRSYNPRRHPTLSPKIRALGLNCEVYPSGLNMGALSFAARRRDYLTVLKHALAPVIGRPRPRVSEIEPTALRHLTGPRVLFLARLWDPAAVQSPEEREERLRINEKRVECIQLLRQQLGELFTGGLIECPVSKRTYPSLVVHASQTRRATYLRHVQRHEICIATAGLHGSTGWKFAEYLAKSRAIVCEQPSFSAPGLTEGTHYLPFDEPGECVAYAEKLLSNPSLRAQMMDANGKYFRRYLRPDALVANAIRQARHAARSG